MVTATLGGILIRGSEALDCAASRRTMLSQLDAQDLEPQIQSSQGSDGQEKGVGHLRSVKLGGVSRG